MDKCHNLSGCPFFNEFEWNTEVIKEGWVRLYCNDLKKSEMCQRKIYKEKNGTPPPNNMSPTGKMLGLK